MLFRKNSQNEVCKEGTREEGIKDEESFWASFVKTERFYANWCKLSPNPECNIEIDLLISLFQKFAQRKLDILDIGSGPVSILSRCSSADSVNILAVDPLAEFYKSILPSNIAEFDVVIPEQVAAEELSQEFEECFFDVVHIRNALDHAVDPIKCLNEMFKITKKNGFLIIHGFENEAVWENWVGMHQWNLYLKNKS